jgi:misacylated tRNA(Ala) deacylase
MVLDRTAFYPEGGGQPTDTGTFTWQEDANEKMNTIPIVRVAKKNDIRHYPASDVDLSGLTPGLKIIANIDWDRRYAHMRMHSSQHLVSAIFYNMYGAYTVGNQIHGDRSRIDFSPLRHEEVDVEDIQRQCNDIISVNPRIKVIFTPRSEIEAQGDAERCNVHLIPASVTELRIVKIEEIELCPCAGTHVMNLGEVGKITIESVRSKGKDKVRITYTLEEST